jgi:hypothetical protein
VKPDENIVRKGNYTSVPLVDIRAKILIKILAN